jgi:LysM repeat protein
VNRPAALAAFLVLVSCAEQQVVPTPPPAPTLAVVTATAGPPAVPTPGKQQIYVVREGDTLSGIAARFGVSEEAILKENPLADRNTLYVGQELVIPPAQP